MGYETPDQAGAELARILKDLQLNKTVIHLSKQKDNYICIRGQGSKYAKLE